MWSELAAQLAVEEAQLAQLLKLHQPLIAELRLRDPTFIELEAAAAFLHSLYSGIENGFRRVAVEIDGEAPSGEAWHKRLLRGMAVPSHARPPVISEELHLRLLEYLNFRHVFRNAYLFQLDWERMSPLILGVESLVENLLEELAIFREAMNASAEG